MVKYTFMPIIKADDLAREIEERNSFPTGSVDVRRLLFDYPPNDCCKRVACDCEACYDAEDMFHEYGTDEFFKRFLIISYLYENFEESYVLIDVTW